jgi:hypothetical protein
MSELRHAASFRVSFKLLEDILQLPVGHRIRRITSELAGLDDALFVIEGPDLLAHEPGAVIHEVIPLYTRNRSDRPGEVSFAGWHHAIRAEPKDSPAPLPPAVDPAGRGKVEL